MHKITVKNASPVYQRGKEPCMKNELQKITQEWMELERKTSKQRQVAETFYEEKLMSLVVAEFQKNNKNALKENVDYLIISVGVAYEPLVLSIKYFQPRRILFLYTELTEDTLNKVVRHCSLEAAQYEKHRVHETDPIDIYREIKQAYLSWGKPEKLYIDFTGGTKAMSAAAAMAAAMIDVQMVYIGTEQYLADFRKPYPGSERLYYIDNPLTVFGDLEVERAMVLFDRANFSGARVKLGVLKETIPDPELRQQLNFIYLSALVYEYWDALDFPKAWDMIKKLNHELERDGRLHRTYVMMDYRTQFKKQEEILGHLNEVAEKIKEKQNFSVLQKRECMLPLMFTMYSNACLREQQEKYDMATLLLYRLLEMIEQRRLALYNLYVSKMSYLNIKFLAPDQLQNNQMEPSKKQEWIKEEVYQIKSKMFRNDVGKYLPDQVSLLEGFMILSALNDPIMAVQHGDPIEKLKRIRSMVFLRNNSIFAHGLGPVSRQDFLRFKLFVVELFREFCKIEKVNFDQHLQDITWLNPTKSVYYSKLGV
mgnify:FL=1